MVFTRQDRLMTSIKSVGCKMKMRRKTEQKTMMVQTLQHKSPLIKRKRSAKSERRTRIRALLSRNHKTLMLTKQRKLRNRGRVVMGPILCER